MRSQRNWSRDCAEGAAKSPRHFGTRRRRGRSLMVLLVFLVSLVSLPAVFSAAASPVNDFNAANKLYREGKYSEAVALYENVLSGGARDSQLYYNLGNAYFRDGRIGRSILSYERASRLAPADEDIRQNLRFANSRKVDRETEEAGLATKLVEWLGSLVSLNGWYIATTLFYLVAIGSGAAILLLRGSGAPFLRRLLVVSVALFCLGGAVYLLKLRVTVWTDVAIVVAPEADAMSGPGGDYTKAFTVHEGTRVVVQRRSEGWLLVRLNSGLGGWVRDGSVENI